MPVLGVSLPLRQAKETFVQQTSRRTWYDLIALASWEYAASTERTARNLRPEMPRALRERLDR